MMGNKSLGTPSLDGSPLRQDLRGGRGGEGGEDEGEGKNAQVSGGEGPTPVAACGDRCLASKCPPTAANTRAA